MTLLLALETSTLTTSAAVLDGSRVVAFQEALATPHSEALLPLVDEVLRAAGVTPKALDLLACGAGPGSFTGLRIGLATAKGLCFALSRPLLGISSLAALALEAEAHTPADGLALAVMDARRGEVYAGLYRLAADAVPVPLLEEAVHTPEALVTRIRELAAGAAITIVGDGIVVAPERLAALGTVPTAARTTPSAPAVGRIAALRWAAGAQDELATATPAYIRLSEAEVKFPPR